MMIWQMMTWQLENVIRFNKLSMYNPLIVYQCMSLILDKVYAIKSRQEFEEAKTMIDM